MRSIMDGLVTVRKIIKCIRSLSASSSSSLIQPPSSFMRRRALRWLNTPATMPAQRLHGFQVTTSLVWLSVFHKQGLLRSRVTRSATFRRKFQVYNECFQKCIKFLIWVYHLPINIHAKTQTSYTASGENSNKSHNGHLKHWHNKRHIKSYWLQIKE